MARSPAPLIVTACAAAYVAFWAVLVAVAVPPAPEARTLPTVASHAGRPAPWAAVAPRVYEEVDRGMRRHGVAQRTLVARAILEEATRAALDPLLVLAVIQVESGFDPHAVSPAGAAGLMQLLGATMQEELRRSRLGSAGPFDPVANVRAGVRYLERMLGAFERLELALMAYNAGPGRIRRHLREGGVPARFLAYPRSVTRARAKLSAAGARPSGRPALALAHAPLDPRAPVRSPGEQLAPSLRQEQPAPAPPASLAVAVPPGPRRRDLGGS